jgi:hypothetical protein
VALPGVQKRAYVRRQPLITEEIVLSPVVIEEVVKPVRKEVNVRSKTIQRWHPFLKVTIPLDGFVSIPRDNWLDVQLKAGIVELL